MYTRPGSYEGAITSSDGWDLVHQQAGVQGLGIGQTQMLDQFSVPIMLIAGATQAFRIVADQRILYGRPAPAPQIVIASSAELALKSGLMTSDIGTFVQTSDTSFNYNGVLEYCLLLDSGSKGLLQTPAPTVAPPKTCIPTPFNSIYFGISSTYGEFGSGI